ncbi:MULTISPECIES: carbohydrate porin [unclassified Aminobacter]|uniref:carbohydrate porin n=1 Tax=unclassified Aminobacter TaxID=2644704 RepID=UPI000464FEEF|nr:MULTISPECIES: carbohydrate porin [unclassified Aminobacter]TWH24527.1 porin [Aminobacter sp. J15]
MDLLSRSRGSRPQAFLPHRLQSTRGIRGCLLSVALLLPGVGAAFATDAAPGSEPQGPPTLTGDWFGQGPALRDAGLDFRLEWSQFYQGMVRGEGDGSWQYGGKVDALARIDLSKLGFWDGLSVTAQGYFNHGDSINGMGGGLLPVNVALLFPGTEWDERWDLMALFVTQRLSDQVSVSVGKFKGLELARATPLKGGGGIDTFWGNLAAPISGITPATFNGALISVPTKPVSYSLMIYDPTDATNQPLFSDLFENGVTINGGATLATSIGGLPGYYSIKGVYSTRTGTDFSEIGLPPEKWSSLK